MAEEINQNQATEAAEAAPKKPAASKDGGDKPAKKEKAPALEDKPFSEFVQQHYLPAVQKAIADEGISDLELSFVKQKLPVKGMEKLDECWQIVGSFAQGKRQFNVYFPDETIKGKKAFSCNEGKQPSTLESFMIDERKVTLELLIWGLTQRLNSQKWLSRN
jgi:hypothetical protein